MSTTKRIIDVSTKALASVGAVAVTAAVSIAVIATPLAEASTSPAALSPAMPTAKFATAAAVKAAGGQASYGAAKHGSAKPKPKAKATPVRHPKKTVSYKTSWRKARVSWYGPGFYGHGMAGGGKLKRTSMIVAHRSLKFGTKVLISYHGKKVIAVVKDRGPFVSGRQFDLGPGTAKALGFQGVGTIRYRIVR